MKIRCSYLALSLVIITLMFNSMSCKKNEIEPAITEFGYDYFPTSLGTTWEYQVDSIQFKPYDNKIDTFNFMVKMVVVDTIVDAAGIKNNVINVYHTDSIGGSYKLNRSLTRRIVDFKAEVTDTNVKVINLVFPPKKLKYWDANAYNTYAKQEYEIIEEMESETIGGNTYDNVMHVLQRNDDFRTVKQFGLEKYAKHFGLVYAEQISWTKERLNDTTEIPDGYAYKYTLMSFKR